MFLNGDIDETIYMVYLENFESGDLKKMAYKLKKSIYDSNKHLGNNFTNFNKSLSRLNLR